MVAVEKMGLLKMDFLGLTTLTILDDTLKLIAQTRGEQITLEAIPLDDHETYKRFFTRVSRPGYFSLNRMACATCCGATSPTRSKTSPPLNALYRPGPIQGGMIDDFIDRKRGARKLNTNLRN